MFATLFEAAVLRDSRSLAEDRLGEAVGAISEVWEPQTTVETLDDLSAAESLSQGRKTWLALMRDELVATA